MHLCTSSRLIYYVIAKTRKPQSAECLGTPQDPFLANFKAAANKLGQKRTQLMCDKHILLTVTAIINLLK